MSWIEIAPGISVNTSIRLPGFDSNPVYQAAKQKAIQQSQQSQLAQAQAQASATQRQQLAAYNQRLTIQRARGNAALTSLRILSAGPNQTGAQASVSRNQSRKKKKKRTTASLRLGSQSSQGGGGGLNIAM